MKKWLLRFKVKMAIRKAERFKKKYKFKYLVLMVKGRPRVYAKFQLKEYIRMGLFKKGVTIQQLEKSAIYKTL